MNIRKTGTIFVGNMLSEQHKKSDLGLVTNEVLELQNGVKIALTHLQFFWTIFCAHTSY